jgi:ERCC4-type nuclease
MCVKLYIDIREHNLIKLLRANNIELEDKNLEIGDIQILYNDIPYIIIERKTMNDLDASIKDGRYREQKIRLQDYKNENQELNIRLMYIIENFKNYQNNEAKINGALINTNIRDNINIVTTQSINDTSQYIIELYKRIQKEPNKYITNYTNNNITNEYLTNVKVKKKKEYITNENIMALQLCQIPSISMNCALIIQDKYKNIKNMIYELDKIENMKDKIKEISELQLTEKRKIGKKIGETIINYLNL